MPKQKSINDFPTGIILFSPLFAETGDLLIKDDRELTSVHVQAFKECGVSAVFVPDHTESAEECSLTLRCIQKAPADLHDGDVIGVAVNDERGRLLIPEGQAIAASHRETLKRVGITRVYIRRDFSAVIVERINNLRTRLKELTRKPDTIRLKSRFEEARIDSARKLDDSRMISHTRVIKTASEDASRTVRIDSTVRSLIEPRTRLSEPERTTDALRVRNVRGDLLGRIGGIFDLLARGKAVDGAEVESIVREVVVTLVGDRHHRLHICEAGEAHDYIVSHSLNVTALSVNIAGRLGYALNEILELAFGALLHDAGMLSVAREIREKPGRLSPAERDAIREHPRLGLEMCKSISGLPLTVPVVVYQENERLDGSGYPEGARAEDIHPYARIVMIAASYDAMVRVRPWREPIKPYRVMKDLLEGVHKGRLDANAMRALMETLSLFPITSRVKLSNGHTGIVLDTVGNVVTRPVVLVDMDPDGNAVTQPVVLDLEQTEYASTKIVEAITGPVDFERVDTDELEKQGA
ncbi:MAG: HD domain-containing protein [Planctomycetes bacterium]|nr:HD domain-containing protein [Planctomycetota bacterium]NUQ34435.1 HD domain-containing protein [Planctomycetaceae bacterium]